MNAKITKSTTKVPTAKKPGRGRPATPEELAKLEAQKPVVEGPAPEATAEAPVTEMTPEATTEPTPEASKAARKGRGKKEAPAGADQKPTPPPGDLVVFALRMTLPERQKLHETAGPARASRFARAILNAAANRDVDAIREIIEATTPAS